MPLTVGTAGHIDHGETWLVRALTGKDTDRLPEERARGISIDLGYAPLELPDGRRLSLVDVGGGNGSLLVELLRRRRGLSGIVFDLPETTRDEASLGERCTFVAGNFFESVPRGDVYILSTILHDWDDERAAAILRTIHAGAPTGARLLIIDAVIPAGNEPHGAKWLDLLMLALFGGRERNELQWGTLLADAGFEPVSMEDGLIEARCR